MNGTEKNAFIFMGGKNFSPEYLTDIPTQNDFIIAADSGCNALDLFCDKVKKISPDIILGDMDSFDQHQISKYKNAEFIKLPAEKDYSDTAVAVDTALDLGYKKIVILGGVGGRLDHTFAVVFLLEYISKKGADGIISDGKNRIYFAKRKNYINTNRKYVSLVPIDEKISGVEMKNFKYPFSAKQLLRDNFVTLSNETCGKVCEITVDKGAALIIETCD